MNPSINKALLAELGFGDSILSMINTGLIQDPEEITQSIKRSSGSQSIAQIPSDQMGIRKARNRLSAKRSRENRELEKKRVAVELRLLIKELKEEESLRSSPPSSSNPESES